MMDFSNRPGRGALPAPATRRAFIVGLGSLALTGCVATPRAQIAPVPPSPPPPVVPAMYQALPNERFAVPAVDVSLVEERFWRTEVDDPTGERPGTLVVHTGPKYLYHVGEGGRATRYGIGVGRDGYAWAGRAVVAYKREWPRWTPPDAMVARQPELEPYSIANGGMDAGPTNPLGARALYIHDDGRDTLYRLHGTHQPESIGQSFSSGCIRLLNQDVIHLHDRVRDGSPILVVQDPAATLA